MRTQKEQEQIENKKRHKEALKTRRAEPDLQRAVPTRQERPLILVVCEGENTEVSYFNQFRLTSARLVALGDGYNTISLVNHAIELGKKTAYDQIWCVFDKDGFTAKDFNGAIEKAKSKGLHVAYSNQAFEYWLLLHFDDHQGGAMNRRDYQKKINEHLKPLGAFYDGNGSKMVTPEFFAILEGRDIKTGKVRRALATQRARRNYENWDHTRPAEEESSTTVFVLVEEILTYI